MSKKQTAGACGPQGENHERALARLIESTARHRRRLEVFSDFVELSALAVSNTVDRRQFEARETRYLEIARQYPAEEFERFPRMLGHLTLALEQHCAVGELGDVLGQVYMQLGLGNGRAGQFFTPYTISRMMALMLVGDGAEARAKGFIDVLEPACGAGGMVIAVADALDQAGLNRQGAMHATCIDIDARCVHMTYLQASLLHIPAIVLHGNSLSGEVWNCWYTPAHVLGGWRTRLSARRRHEPVPVVLEDARAPATDPAPPAHRRPQVSPGLVQQLSLFGLEK